MIAFRRWHRGVLIFLHPGWGPGSLASLSLASLCTLPALRIVSAGDDRNLYGIGKPGPKRQGMTLHMVRTVSEATLFLPLRPACTPG